MAITSCILKTANPAVYQAWKQKILDENFNAESFKLEFISASIKLKNKSLSSSEKIKILKNILQDIKLEFGADAYELVKQDLDPIIEELNAENSVKNPTKVVVKPQLVHSNKQLEQIKDILGVSSELGQFVPIVSTEINAFITEFIQSRLAEICVWDSKNGTMTVSDTDITQAIVNFQRELINILIGFTGLHGVQINSVFMLDDQSAKNYRLLLIDAWDKIKQNTLQNSQGVFKTELTDSAIQAHVMPIMAFYALQNFDSVIQQMLSDVVTIDANEFGSLDISLDKYKRKQKQRKNFSWSSDVHSADGENIADNILITFINNTQVSKGKSLEKSFLDALVICSEIVQNEPMLQNDPEEQILYATLEGIWNSGSNIDIDGHIDNLIGVLQSDNSLTRKLGWTRCEAFANRLNAYMKAYRDYYKTLPASIQREMDLHINIGAKLINQFTGKGVLGFVQFNEDGTVNYLQSGYKKKAKEGIKKQITTALTRCIQDTDFNWFAKGVMLGSTSADWIVQLNSPLTIQYLTQITGLNFADPDVRDKFQGFPLIVTEFVRTFRHIVLNALASEGQSIEKICEDIMKELVLTQSYVVFTNVLVEDNDFHAERIFSADRKEQPKTTIATLTTQLPVAVRRFKRSGFDTQANIITANNSGLIRRRKAKLSLGHFIPQSDFIQHINYAGDVTLPNGETKKWVELTETLLFEEWIGGLYLDSLIRKKVLSFQLDAASDKPKVPIVTIQAISGNLNFLTMNEQDILELRFNQSRAYYQKVQELTVNKWKTLFKNDPAHTAIQNIRTLKLLNDYLSNHPEITVQTLAERLIQILAVDPNFTFLQQIDYCANKDGKLSMNNCLLHEIDRISHDVKYYQNSCETAWNLTVKTLIKYLPHFHLNLDKLSKDEKSDLADLLDVDVSKLPETIALLETSLTKQNLTDKNSILYKFYRKWYHLMNLVREADTQLLQKHYWAHGKNEDNIIEEETTRINKSKKRNNALSATFSPLQQGLLYGVPEQIRTATIEGLTTIVQNHLGQQETLNAHDGAIFSSYILRLLERFSSQDVHVSNVSKIIALSQADAGFEQIKCADYAMTNEWIRNTLTARDHGTQHFSGHLLMRKMLSPAKIGNTFFNTWSELVGDRDLFTVLGVEPPIVYFQGRAAKLKSIQRIKDNWVLPVWEYLDSETGDELVPISIVQKTLGFESGIYINNLYDLWKVLGAEYSHSVNDDGEIVFSDASQEIVTYMMCLFDPSLKSQMIGKIIDHNASKSTMQFRNDRKRVFSDEDPLVTGTLLTSAYGVQLDSSHLSEEDSISSLTQVINAIGLNGQNPQLANQMYELLGKLTTEAMQELVDLLISANKTDFYIKLGKSIGKQLMNNKVISNAATILNQALLKVIPNNETFANSGLPISSNQLYHFVTSELLSKLNRIIKQKFAGTAVVQNPAQGIMGVYEDVNGVVYSSSEIITKAFNWYKGQLNKDLYTVDDIVKAYLLKDPKLNQQEPNFLKKELTIDNWSSINIGDIIEIDGVEYTIDRPFQLKLPSNPEKAKKAAENPIYQELGLYEVGVLILKALKNKKKCYKKLDKKRNLSTTNIWWLEERIINTKTNETITIGNNLWMLDSTKALMDAEYGSLDYKAKLSWHQTNLKLLQENKAYIATWELYTEWVKERNVITRNKYLTKVKNLKKKGGEEVLPKYYKTKLGITGSLADIKNKDSKHFEALIAARVNLHPDINLSEYTSKNSPNTFAVSLGDVDIVFYHDPDAQMYTNAIIETVGQKQHLTTTEGDTFDQFNVKGLDASFNIITREKGKSIIYVNLHNSIDLASYKYVLGLLKRIPERSIKGVHAGDPTQDIWNRITDEKSGLLISPDNTLPDWIDKTNSILSENLEKEAIKTYNSFLLSLKTISARIPSQSYQSFLSNETVAFTDGEENNGYMNLWEMWFLGSKL